MMNTVAMSIMGSKRMEMLANVRQIKVPKSGYVLAERLREEILKDTYPVGSPLPTERELVSATGLSRGSVREALRILESQGLVETKAGRYGGSTVSQPSDDLLASHINLYAKGRSVSLLSLIEVRLALEPMVAQLAAQSRTEEDLGQLQKIAKRLDSAADSEVEVFLEENANWHDALTGASHNELLCAFAKSVRGLMYEASRIENFASQDVRRRVCAAHHRIFDAIAAGDSEAARRRVEKDLMAYARDLEAALAAVAKSGTKSVSDV